MGRSRSSANFTIRHNTYDFLFAFHRNYASFSVPILHRLRDMASYLLKVSNFSYQTCIWCPVEVTPLEFDHDLWHQKTRVPGLLCSVVGMMKCFAILIELRPVLDGQTNTRQQHILLWCAQVT